MSIKFVNIAKIHEYSCLFDCFGLGLLGGGQENVFFFFPCRKVIDKARCSSLWVLGGPAYMGRFPALVNEGTRI